MRRVTSGAGRATSGRTGSALIVSLVLVSSIGGCATQETARLPPEPVYLRGDDRPRPAAQHWSARQQSGYEPLPQRQDWAAPTPGNYRNSSLNASNVPPPNTYRAMATRPAAPGAQPQYSVGRWTESPRGYPIAPGSAGAASQGRLQPSQQPRAIAASPYGETAYGKPLGGGPVGSGQPFMIQVRAGDTLFGLARRHGVGVNELMAANNLPSARIEVGQVLLLPNR
jgi:hypothetical protein